MGNIVEVLDGLMSTGKSTQVLKWMDSNPNNRYIFVSPLLTEVEEGGRVCSSVSNITFECPSVSEYETKSEHLLQLLKDGSNIACTHSLYLAVNDEHLKYIKELNYILIIDEEIDVISSVDGYSKDDYQWLYDNNKISVSENDGMVSWMCNISVGYDNKYYKFKMLCDYQALYVTKRNSNMMVTQLPIKLMTCANRVIVLTYMFKGNILDCFLKLKGIEVKDFKDVTIAKVDGNEIRSLITLLPLNKSVSDLALSSTWYGEANKKQLDTVGNFISSVGRKYCGSFDDMMYTGFALAFARGVGEYGSVIFIAGNQPFKTEIAPLMIISRLEEYDYAGATTIAVVMLVLSFAILFLINLLQAWASRRTGRTAR